MCEHVHRTHIHKHTRDSICVTTMNCNFGVYFWFFAHPFLWHLVLLLLFSLFYHHFATAFLMKWHFLSFFWNVRTFYCVFVVCIHISTKLKFKPVFFSLPLTFIHDSHQSILYRDFYGVDKVLCYIFWKSSCCCLIWWCCFNSAYKRNEMRNSKWNRLNT